MTPAHLIPSPLGDIAIRIEDDALMGLFFVGQKYYPSLAIASDAHADARNASPLARKVAEEVAEYFTGARETFSVPIHLRGTAFQRSVWKQLLAIPFGELVSYGDITERVGLPMSAARAVGGAVGRNPVSIMVPCHRVIGASGSLTGYAGGIERKRALLSLEGARFQRGERHAMQQSLAF
ncbi:methylated-DNA--[protein]-cysteine S-methyltransferase [Burkholderia anthina]|uniref:methylated-DNA--[protein]-cysteine S-methyltransferase n=1 Tax=Burkholderia anthina TaxID=179879 RepID=UPI00158D560D|nr:methylated-DNA--[protein]-cysteine S-methyltransferase [Burkholderia anthina]